MWQTDIEEPRQYHSGPRVCPCCRNCNLRCERAESIAVEGGLDRIPCRAEASDPALATRNPTRRTTGGFLNPWCRPCDMASAQIRSPDKSIGPGKLHSRILCDTRRADCPSKFISRSLTRRRGLRRYSPA